MKNTLESCTAQLGASLRGFPWAEREAYADWLAQTYYYVRHSTRLLGASASRFAHEPLGDRLHVRFTAHMAEEKRHEMLAVHDLRSLGGALDRFDEHASTRMFYEPQYYKIEHHGPVGLFGYRLLLEAMSAEHGPWLIDQIRATHTEPCTSFLKLRAAYDGEHLERSLIVLDEAKQHHARIIENMRQTTLAYQTMLVEIRRAADGRPRLVS